MGFEFTILDFIQENMRCGFLDTVLPFISRLGNKGFIWILGASLLIVFSNKYKKHGLLILAILLTGVIIGNLFLKNIVMRPRPCWINESVDMLTGIPKDYSFPSGHTLSSFGAATGFMYTDRRMGIFALVLALIIAFSRMYLYVHFPTDILGGMILGTGIALAEIYIFRRVTGG